MRLGIGFQMRIFILTLILFLIQAGCQKQSELKPRFVTTPVDGKCHNEAHYQCLNKTIPSNTREEDDFYKWSCLGLYGGANTHECSQEILVEPIPGQCNNERRYQCFDGTTPDNTREEDGFYRWSCLGLHRGENVHDCRLAIPPEPILGQCDLETYYQCLNGTRPENTKEEDGFYKWSCLGLHGGDDVHDCSLAIPPGPIPGQCDTQTHYQCLNGTTPDNTREEDGFYKWSCLGLYEGEDVHNCQLRVVTIKQDSFEVSQGPASTSIDADILIVIDNSGSMRKYQEQLGGRFGNLTSGLQNVNWQMAFINTDTRDSSDGDNGSFYNLEDSNGEIEINGNKLQILTPSLSNAQDLFLNTIRREETGSPREFPLTNIVRAIGLSQNRTFFRESAALVVIMLTNEGSETETAETTISAVKNQFGETKRFFVYGIICLANCRVGNGGNENYFVEIKKLITRTGGLAEDIDATDYSHIIQRIGSSIGANLTLTEVNLRYPNVIPGSISLTFTPSTNAITWNFDNQANKIVFSQALPENTSVLIEYSYKE